MEVNPHLFRHVASGASDARDAIGFCIEARAAASLAVGPVAAHLAVGFLDQQVLRTFGFDVGAALAIP